MRRSFGRMRVLRDIDLTLAPGEALAVAGPNGAGKTTLLRLLAGLMRPTSGEVRVLGRPLTRGDGEVRRALGLVSHQSLLYDDLTLLENLMFAATLYGLERPRESVSRRAGGGRPGQPGGRITPAIESRPDPAGRHSPRAAPPTPGAAARRALHGARRGVGRATAGGAAAKIGRGSRGWSSSPTT